jgi:hypothetical protein
VSVPTGRVAGAVTALPPSSFFLTSAVFHYLGPSLAVLLFDHVDVLGVAWLRIASAAVVFALWRRPWRVLRRATPDQRRVLVALGAVLAAMNSLFYLAVDRLPLATVGAVEFLGTIVLAAAGARTRRNLLALALAVGGVAVPPTSASAGSRSASPSPSPTAPASCSTSCSVTASPAAAPALSAGSTSSARPCWWPPPSPRRSACTRLPRPSATPSGWSGA